MKRSKFSEAQIAFVLKQAEDGRTIGEVCRKAGISYRPSSAFRAGGNLMSNFGARIRHSRHVEEASANRPLLRNNQ